MDPDANVREQIELHKSIRAFRADGAIGAAEYAVARLHELRRAYSSWRAAGGFAADPDLLGALRANQAQTNATSADLHAADRAALVVRNADLGVRAIISVVGADQFAAEPFQDSIADTVADVLHFAASCGLDIRALADRACEYVVAERNGTL